jgi:hypothetical protein
MEPTLSAHDIANELLERTGAGLMTGDFGSFVGCFHVPCVIETLEGKRFLNSKCDVRTVYDNVRTYYRAQSVTSLLRECISAEFKACDTIHTTSITRLLRENEALFRRPFPISSVLRKFDDGWKITYSQYAIEDAPKHNKALSG